MPIVGDHPETGVRIQLERDRSREVPPFEYAGAAHVPGRSFPLAVTVEASGEVSVAVSPSAADGAPPPPELAEKVRLIVRAAYRQAASDGEPPAWRIVRWRGEK